MPSKEKEMPNEITKVQQFSLAPTTFAEAERFSAILSKSDFVPKDYQGKPGNILAALQMGMELGLAPMQALQNISVINGRPSVWGDAALAIVMSSPQYEGMDETDDGTTATCVMKRRGRPAITRKFSMDDAKKAGLLSKPGPWQSYPARMRQMRARSWALRDAFPDVLRGLITREEAQDYIDVEVVKPQPPVNVKDESPTDDNVQTRDASWGDVDIVKEPEPEGLTEEHFINLIAAASAMDELKAVGAEIKASGLRTQPLIDAYVKRQNELKKENA